jgi:hypothetical protein
MNKLLRLSFAGLLLLAGCSKSGSDPSPTPPTPTIVGTWEWESESLVAVYKDGRAGYTQNKVVTPKSVFVTYGTDGYITGLINGVAQPRVAYAPIQVGVPVASTNKGFAVTKTVTELTSTHMTQVEVDQDNTVTYTTTDTYKR